MRSLLRAAAGAAVLTLAGCGGTADVTGKVTYQGKPVVFGSVVMVGSDGIPKSGAIQPDGTFRVSGVPVGAAKVAVTSPKPPGAPAAGKKAKAGRGEADDERAPADEGTASPEVVKNWFPLPEKFGDPNQSGLTADVKSGQPVNLDLK